MNPLYIFLWLLVLFTLLHLAYYLLKGKKDEDNETGKLDEKSKNPIIPIRWWSSTLSESDRKAVEKYQMKPGTMHDWDIYFPGTYEGSEIQRTLVLACRRKSGSPLYLGRMYLFLVSGSIEFVSKVLLWKNLVKRFGLASSSKIVPRSYILSDSDDVSKLRQLKSPKRYIAKGNAQRQETIHLIPNLDELDDEFYTTNNRLDSKYVLVQEYLEDPLLINSRKINLRIYLLITVESGRVRAYTHQEGFVYYTRESYSGFRTMDRDGHITTGYIDRQVYRENPHTLGDFRDHIGDANSKVVFGGIDGLIVKVMKAVEGGLRGGILGDVYSFQIYGIDVAVLSDLRVYLMEFNRGPDFSWKDSRDGWVKTLVMDDMYRTIGLLGDGEKNRFRLIWEN